MIGLLQIVAIGTLVTGLCSAAAYFKGQADGQEIQVGRQSKADELVQQVRDASIQGAAEAIAKIEVKHVTIQGRLQREVQTNTVYRECEHTPAGLMLINSALENRSPDQPADSVPVPKTDAASRPIIRGNH